MTTAVARIEDSALTGDKVALLRRTLCPDLNNDEMELFAAVCNRTKLDPFAKQIYGMKRKGKLTIQTGIDGFRVIAVRTGELDGQEGPFWCGKDGAWKDVWVEQGPPVAAKVIVWRKGCSRAFTGIAKFAEYAEYYNGQLSHMWGKMSANQIAKCAEALALRKAFPADLSGLYTEEEMAQAGEPDAPVTQSQPAPAAQQPQLPAAKTSAPAPQTESADDRVRRQQKLGNPLNDSLAIKELGMRKGFTLARIYEGLNTKFKAAYTPTTPWGDVSKTHREAAVKQLEAMPDLNSAIDLETLVKRVATATKATPEHVFLKYAIAAELHECVTAPEHMTKDQLEKACNSFRAKLDSLADVPDNAE
ncbi:RecT family protein [Gemmata sp. SH-PL17]|uniref:phage recombination protein Bet n=1 Tax=Gemmata sp. SH-PL17 TaxID=1630693 RepID=UPI00078CF246|nr:phage recombination protein Bet [Gemmata sp. SH-PL17]AMV23449.1 RecT family protein [Gemmata sp. SH-PL17]